MGGALDAGANGQGRLLGSDVVGEQVRRMLLTQDMRDFVEMLGRHGVDYLLVGGFAVNYYGYVRTTQDIDFLIRPTPDNAARMMTVLEEFGFSKAGIPREALEREGTAIHLGVAPNRIDLLTHLEGLAPQEVFIAGNEIIHDGLRLRIIDLPNLIRCKRNSTRLKDLADAEELEQIAGDS